MNHVTLARQLYGRWQGSPTAFAREALGYEPWSRQRDLFEAAASSRFVAVRSGHKCSKSRSIATLALWWVCTRPRARVVFTAPTGHQVSNIIWPELRSLYTGARHGLGGRLFEDPHKGLKFADGREAFGVATDKSESLAGLSSENLLFLVDEASGFDERLFTAVFGNLAGGGRVVLTGNPTQTSGTYYDAFHSKRHNWTTLHISSLESPNFHGGHVPGLATPEWAEWAAEQWGKDSPAWDVRVLGNFPSQGSNAVIGLALVEAARARYDATPDDGPLSLGVDPARFGDDETVVAARRGQKIVAVEARQGLDGPAVAGFVLEVIKGLRRPGEPKPRVKIDPIGIGASPVDALKDNKDIELLEVGAGESATSEDYVRMRDQLWFAARDWLASGGALPPDEKLTGELVAPTYSLDPRGRMKVEGKDDIKKRLKRSPDRADALALCVYEPPRAPRVKPPPVVTRNFETSGIG